MEGEKKEHLENPDDIQIDKSANTNFDKMNMNTMSTKLSTDQLICKTPQESPSVSVKSLKTRKKRERDNQRIILFLGVLQFVLGLLMVAFGIMVIVHKATLSQLGGGIWAGCLAMSTGVAGILTAAGSLCPLKETPQKVAYTVFLALSLISLAISQLIVVIAAIGLARDLNKASEMEKIEHEEATYIGRIVFDIPKNYMSLLFNIALIISASLECICAALSSYKSSRDLCPCFRRNEETYKENINIHRSHAIVSSWLGKQTVPQPIYVVTTGPPSTLGGRSKLSGLPMGPIYTLPPPSMIQPQVIGYPLIPAPLGPVPSPIIPPPSRKEIVHRVHKKYRKSKSKSRERDPTPRRSRSKSLSHERQITEADVARTYTGLDRTIAEEFIDTFESKNNSLCSSDFSSTSSCQSPCNAGCNSNSDAASQEYLVNKV